MRVIGNCYDGGDQSGGERGVVVVGVKLDVRSRELLTWALVKLTKPGDLIVALHILDTNTENKASLISLVKTFDSMLGVYEGFCNLKQVDLKLKLCRGTKIRDVLVKEAVSLGAAALIVGTSKTHHTIRSSASLAKHCGRKLPKHIAVFAVDSSKTVYKREATTKIMEKSQDVDYHSKSINDSRNPTSEKSVEEKVDYSLALVPSCPKSSSSWPFLRRILFPTKQNTCKHMCRRSILAEWFRRLRGRYSAAIVHPDQKQSRSNSDEDHDTSLDGENGALVVFGSQNAALSISPHNGDSYKLPEELEGLHERCSSTCRLFSYQELLLATSDFSPENLVGKGGSSYVYRGCLPDGKELAVKRLKPSIDVMKEFVLEIDIITTLHHKNIIFLFGFCYEDNNLLLVYDYLSRGSLEDNLHGTKKDAKEFGWPERYKVTIGVAEALDYLQNGREQPVIHRDVKSSNILLSDDFEPQLSDFGLASWDSNMSSPATSTDVAGTFGYLAPEYFMHGRVSDKIDVYAFGVVILELLTGRKPIQNGFPKGRESLVMWAYPILKDGKLSELLDPSLGRDYDETQIERLVLAATLCIRRSPRLRPQISLVLKLLQGDTEVTNWARQQANTEEQLDPLDGETFPTNIQTHLNLALLDLDDESLSVSSMDQSISIEDYLKGRWSRSSSFD